MNHHLSQPVFLSFQVDYYQSYAIFKSLSISYLFAMLFKFFHIFINRFLFVSVFFGSPITDKPTFFPYSFLIRIGIW